MAEFSHTFNGDRFDDLDRLIAEALEENRIAMSALSQRIRGYFVEPPEAIDKPNE